MDTSTACGYMLLQRRDQYFAEFRETLLQFDDEAHDLRARGVSFQTCIRRPDGIHISAEHVGTRYDLHFRPGEEDTGSYTISHGSFAGTGRIFKTRRGDSSSFAEYYYLRAVSTTGVEFAWSVGIDHFSLVVDAYPSLDEA
jgi:hypothetical protein